MLKKKIGIITIHKVNNYGAELQAFALQEKLVSLGFDAEIIDYLHYKHKDFKYTKKARPFVALGFKRRTKEFFFPLFSQVQSLPHHKARKRREAAFELFHHRNTRLSPVAYRSIDELYEKEFDYDVYMVGSDQVWNPFSNVSLKPYFLDFAPAGKPKVSYASSFGVTAIPEAAKPIYRDCLKSFNRIGVREEQGVGMVAELTGLEACHVVDPSLLLDKEEWRKFGSEVAIDEPYLLLYVLTPSDYATQLARRIADHLHLKQVRICIKAVRQDRDSSIRNIIDAGPSEFIWLFEKASFVITNSFHGTAFSVNFQKPFYTVLPRNKPNNSRQEGLLKSLDLEDRLLSEGDDLPDEQGYIPCFTTAVELLSNLRGKSEHYLLEAANAS